MFVAPKATVAVSWPVHLLLHVGILGGAVAALAAAGRPTLAWWLGLAMVINGLLMYSWGVWCGTFVRTILCVSLHNVAIGRTLRPFPRSKRSRPVSRHSAFQLGCTTRPVRTSRCRLRGAPGGRMGAYRHLRSPRRPFACLACSFPWWTVALSGP